MLQEIKEKLKLLSCAELKEVSLEINVSYDTLISIRIGRAKNPTLATITAIQEYFDKK